MIIYYNQKGIGDVLIVRLKDAERPKFERRGSVARVFDSETNEAIGFNFFQASAILGSTPETGRIKADSPVIEQLNHGLSEAGFSDRLSQDTRPTIVTGYVENLKRHPDSDHMHVCTVDVGDDHLQIVCGAPNIDQGQKVVVAKVGALMPDGLLIRPSVLRGVASEGMICSARELHLPGAPKKRGILVLDPDTEPGQDFFALQPIH